MTRGIYNRAHAVHKFMSVRWPGMTIVDATEDVVLHLNTMDIGMGIPQDPENCALAESCKRMYDSEHVLFLKSVAYLDAPLDAKEAAELGMKPGERVIKRYTLPLPTQKTIREFDDTSYASAAGYRLKAPNVTETLIARTAQRMARKKRVGAVVKPRGKRIKPISATSRHGAGSLRFRVKV